uniref:F-box domain-containing protein n=1 Tax=Panagrellus redivivus TaxID=6233 RepID=A0A7E4VMR4_PANRE
MDANCNSFGFECDTSATMPMFNIHNRFRAIRRHFNKTPTVSEVHVEVESEPTTILSATAETASDIDSGFDSGSQQSTDVPSVTSTSMSTTDLLALPKDALEEMITKLDTCALYAFRNRSPEAAEAAAFRGIQTHSLFIDPTMPCDEITSFRRRGKIVTRAGIDAVLDAPRVAVKFLLKIGNFHEDYLEMLARTDLFQSRFTSLVIESNISYVTLESFLENHKTCTIELKDGIRLPESNTCQFWDFFRSQRASSVRKLFNSRHIIIEATYDSVAEIHNFRVVPCPDDRKKFYI